MGLNPKGKARVMVIWRADGLGWIVRWPLGKLTKKQAWLGPKQTGQTRFSYPVEKRVRPVCTWLGPKQTGQTLVKVFPFLEKECSVQAWIYADQAWGDSRYFKIGYLGSEAWIIYCPSIGAQLVSSALDALRLWHVFKNIRIVR